MNKFVYLFIHNLINVLHKIIVYIKKIIIIFILQYNSKTIRNCNSYGNRNPNSKTNMSTSIPWPFLFDPYACIYLQLQLFFKCNSKSYLVNVCK